MANVLVVDDDSSVSEAIAEILASEGHAVQIAADGLEGLRRMFEALPDLIVLDIEMPVLSGPEMAKQILIADAGHELIPIVLISGVADLRQVAVLVGTPYALPKPCGLDALLDVTAEALRVRTPPQPSRAFVDSSQPKDKATYDE